METTNGPAKRRPGVWMYISFALVLVCAFLVWKLVTTTSEVKELKVEKEGLTDEKSQMIAKLEKLQREYEQLSEENESLSEMFEKEKENVERLLEQIKSAQGSVAKYKGQIASLEARLKEYEEQIEELKEQNIELVEENFDIKTTLDSALLENKDLQEENVDLNATVAKGSVLTAYDLNAGGIKITGKGKEIPTVKSKKAEKIRICFTIGENAIATSGKKDVYLRIADPYGEILCKTSDNANSFEFEGRTLQYSMKESINYQNEAVDVCSYWAKDADFVPGSYTVDIFVDGEDIGTIMFKFEK